MNLGKVISKGSSSVKATGAKSRHPPWSMNLRDYMAPTRQKKNLCSYFSSRIRPNYNLF